MMKNDIQQKTWWVHVFNFIGGSELGDLWKLEKVSG